MSEKKFKIGNRVKFIGQSRDLGWLGKLNTDDYGTIDSFDDVSDLYLVNFSHFTSWAHEVELEIVKFDDNGLLSAMRDALDETKGVKHDQGKPDLSLIPTDALWGMAAALTYGANKYQRHNFRNGISYSRLVAATMRHLSAWNEGENTDLESKLDHIDHALASLGMLKYMIVNKPEMDDRYIVKKPVDKK